MTCKCSNISEDYIKSVVKELCDKNNVCDWSLIQQQFDVKVQNYFGELIPVTITGKNNNENIVLNVVLKLAPTDERFRVSGAITRFFEREIFFYSSVSNCFDHLQSNDDTKLIVPKCYYFRNDYCKEVIAIENMSHKSFRPYLEDFLNYDHMVLSLKALAHLHAMSLILKNTDESQYNDFAKFCIPLNNDNNKRFFTILLDRLDKVIDKFDGTSYIPFLKDLKLNCIHYVESICVNAKATTICHGDIWKENILYKYENDIPTAACIIDYQTARTSSPAMDVLYLIATSTDKKLREEHLQNFFDIYYKELKDTLTTANLNTNTIYSADDFKSDLKLVAPACVIIANTAMWLSNGLQQEGHVRSKKVLNTDKEKATAVERYKTIIKDIIDDFRNVNLLDK